MKKRFLALYESWLTRSNHGGFLVGDIVKFKDNALKHDHLKTLSDEAVKAIKALVDCKGTIRVTNVINKYPAVMGSGNPDSFGPDFSVEVSEDTGGGRLGNSAVVHAGMIEKIDTVPNLEPVPDKNKRNDRVSVKPEVVKDEAEEIPFYSPARTRTSDLGNGKLSPGDRSLKNVNTKIPATPAVTRKDPASYTADYLPKA
jgi:hypothetical protein